MCAVVKNIVKNLYVVNSSNLSCGIWLWSGYARAGNAQGFICGEGTTRNNTTKRTLGFVYRCNNVLYIRGVEEEEEDGEMRE